MNGVLKMPKCLNVNTKNGRCSKTLTTNLKYLNQFTVINHVDLSRKIRQLGWKYNGPTNKETCSGSIRDLLGNHQLEEGNKGHLLHKKKARK